MYGTHHIGAGTLQAESAVGEEAARVVRVFSKKGKIEAKNWVNMKLMPKLWSYLKITHIYIYISIKHSYLL